MIMILKVFYPNKSSFFGTTTSWFKAVDDISFNVYKGETLGLIGESGCGKTTVGKTIIGLLKPSDGTILYHGNNIENYSKVELLN